MVSGLHVDGSPIALLGRFVLTILPSRWGRSRSINSRASLTVHETFQCTEFKRHPRRLDPIINISRVQGIERNHIISITKATASHGIHLYVVPATNLPNYQKDGWNMRKIKIMKKVEAITIVSMLR